MTSDVVEFFGGAKRFVEAFDAWVPSEIAAVADHICYRCVDAEEFERLRAMFEHDSRFIYQSIIAKRRIAVIGFEPGIPTTLGELRVLELSDQKPDGSQTSGFDHIEIFPTQGTVDDLAAQLTGQGTHFEKVVRPHHTTYDAAISGTFKVRLEAEPLLEKIKREEMQ